MRSLRGARICLVLCLAGASSASLAQSVGLSRPAADVLGIQTSGSERVRVDASGRVGIGTTNPTQALTVTGNISLTGNIVGGVSTDADALSAITLDFTNINTIRATGAAAACGTLNFTNLVAGGQYTVTIPNANASCTTIQMAGAGTNVKLPSGYTGGVALAGVVYTAIYDGTTLWVSYVPF